MPTTGIQTTGVTERRTQPRRRRTPGPAERAIAYAVLAVLCVILVALLVTQSNFNPAVNVALKQLPPPTGAETPAAQALTGAAAPFAEDFPGLAAAAQPEQFDSETLSDKIDGKAELYLSSGFKAMACRSYTVSDGAAAGARIEISVYEMESPTGAFAVFSGQRRSGAASSSLTRDAYMTENALFFGSGAMYVEIVADRASESVTATLAALGKDVLARLPGTGTEDAADPASLFPKEGLNAETVRLTASDAFGLEGFNNVYTGEYALESGEGSAFLSPSDSPEGATASGDKYLKFLKDNGYKEEAAEGLPDGAALLGFEGYYEVVFTRGRILAGVHEASSTQVAVALARALGSALEAKSK